MKDTWPEWCQKLKIWSRHTYCAKRTEFNYKLQSLASFMAAVLLHDSYGKRGPRDNAIKKIAEVLTGRGMLYVRKRILTSIIVKGWISLTANCTPRLLWNSDEKSDPTLDRPSDTTSNPTTDTMMDTRKVGRNFGPSDRRTVWPGYSPPRAWTIPSDPDLNVNESIKRS
jgi:hypothetical protein